MAAEPTMSVGLWRVLLALVMTVALAVGRMSHPAERCADAEAYMLHFDEARQCVDINQLPR